ncbi:hypothetical protein CAEBREN_30701 [Caenorhabditis brenneri]|uniref:Uncharacterized protein n=1 Tax=Caenorhabditis brenneri TaxID=135651 RepID=G0NAA6_CAEBE|nr:hypothetical protein CAEBREN_30701 [Caenorhabditis brenneri]
MMKSLKESETLSRKLSPNDVTYTLKENKLMIKTHPEHRLSDARSRILHGEIFFGCRSINTFAVLDKYR